ncbi:MAG: hypothetical protein IJU44_03670, partial [Kiritimatiellae bacterium]|nr:hypothetical protein [Kiritimatiellia bacterium]
PPPPIKTACFFPECLVDLSRHAKGMVSLGGGVGVLQLPQLIIRKLSKATTIPYRKSSGKRIGQENELKILTPQTSAISRQKKTLRLNKGRVYYPPPPLCQAGNAKKAKKVFNREEGDWK